MPEEISPPLVGSSILHLNQATLMRAVAYYLEREVFKEGTCPKVVSVAVDTSARSLGDTLHIVVNLLSEEAKP